MTVVIVPWKVVTYNLLKTEHIAVPLLNHDDMWEGRGIAQQFLTSALEMQQSQLPATVILFSRKGAMDNRGPTQDRSTPNNTMNELPGSKTFLVTILIEIYGFNLPRDTEEIHKESKP